MISYPGPPDTTLIYMNLTLDLPWEDVQGTVLKWMNMHGAFPWTSGL